jgi:hypothetical protein
MDPEVARDVARAGQAAGIVPLGSVDPGGDGRSVDPFPDLDLGADAKPVAR